MDVLVYDVEVIRGPDEVQGGWQNPEAMGIGTAVVYSYKRDEYLFFGQGQEEDLSRLLDKNVVVGFNSISFDNRVLLGNELGKRPSWNDCDLLVEAVKSKFGVKSVDEAKDKVGFKTLFDGSLKLDAICERTIGMTKTGEGALAPKLIKEGRWAEVYAYNLHDVRMTKQLYDFVLKYQYLIDGNGLRIPIQSPQRWVTFSGNGSMDILEVARAN